MYSDGSLEGFNVDNLEVSVSETEYSIIQGPEVEVLFIIQVAAYIIKLGGLHWGSHWRQN